MRQTFIYRITDKNGSPERYIYAVNKPAAKRWQLENCPDIKAEFECLGIKKIPIEIHAQEFSPIEYAAISKHYSDMSNPDLWKELMKLSQ